MSSMLESQFPWTKIVLKPKDWDSINEAKLSQKCGMKMQKDKLFMNFHTAFPTNFLVFVFMD